MDEEKYVIVTTSDGDGHLVMGTREMVRLKVAKNPFLLAIDRDGEHDVHCAQVTGIHDATDKDVETFMGD